MAYEGFKKVEESAAASGATNPGAVAAAIGREKYGKAAFQKAAAKGDSMRGDKLAHHPHDVAKHVAENSTDHLGQHPVVRGH